MNAIEVTNLRKQYPGFTLDNISFQLPRGCIMGFVGENGAGKSTTIKLLLDLIRADGGSVRLLGQDPRQAGKELREKIGVVIEECGFPQNMSIKSIRGVLRDLYSTWDDAQFGRLVKQFDLPEKKPLKEYSKGMRMKLSIAIALSHHSELLILDEATSGLDPVVRDEILDVFLEFIQDERHSVFLSSHIISDLEKICDYVTFLHKGKLIFSNTKEELEEKYAMLSCSKSDLRRLDPRAVIGVRENEFGAEALVIADRVNIEARLSPASIEEIMVFTIKGRERRA